MQTRFLSTLKIAAVVSAAALAQACTIHWNGLIENKSAHDITIVGDSKKKPTWHVKSDEKVKLDWEFRCIEVVEEGASYYFEGGNVPKQALRFEGVNYTVYALYRDHQLYFLFEDGNVKPLAECKEPPEK